MDYKLLALLVVSCFVVASCGVVQENKTQERARTTLRNFIPCAVRYDVACLVDNAENYLEDKRLDLLAEADAEAFKMTGRADKDSTPSALAETISKMIEELTGMFRDGISSLFRSGKEAEDDDEIEESTEVEEAGKNPNKSRALVEEGRKKKKEKIKKLIGVIKFLVLGGALKAVIGTLLKIFHAKLQVKFLLIALAGLALNAARFWLDLKKGHSPQKVIYYEHAQHQHHYEGDEEYGHSGPGGGYWGRAYDEAEEKKTAQDLAYGNQKPLGVDYAKVDNKPNYSWLG